MTLLTDGWKYLLLNYVNYLDPKRFWFIEISIFSNFRFLYKITTLTWWNIDSIERFRSVLPTTKSKAYLNFQLPLPIRRVLLWSVYLLSDKVGVFLTVHAKKVLIKPCAIYYYCQHWCRCVIIASHYCHTLTHWKHIQVHIDRLACKCDHVTTAVVTWRQARASLQLFQI